MISVLMPVYNVEAYLRDTVDSLRRQTYGDFEVVMIDDGSTDESPRICDEIAAVDPRFRVFHGPNRGVSAARNRALEEARGDTLFFMDSDDRILPETLEELSSAMVQQDADMVAGDLFYVDDDGVPIDRLNTASPVKNETLTNLEYLKKLTEPNANYYCTSTNKLFRRALFDGITYPVGKINEDEARIHEVIYRCKRIVTLRKCYYTYIKHGDSITGARFGLKNLDRDEAFVGRIRFLETHGLEELACDAALAALDAMIGTFASCVKGGLYYGKTRETLARTIDFEYSYAVRRRERTLKQRKILLIGWLMKNFPELYAYYISLRVKIGDMGFGAACKDELYELILKGLSLLPTRDTIVFESNPVMSGNTYPVFRLLLERELNKKYRFIWLGDGKPVGQPAPNVTFLRDAKHARSVSEKLRYMYTVSTAKALVYSNRLLGAYGRGRVSLCLQHGMPLKSSNGTYCINNRCTAALCESPFFADNYSADFRVDREKMLFFGFPRNDLLFQPTDAMEKFGFTGYKKVIFWLPTFRQRNDNALNKRVAAYEMERTGSGIPAIETREDMLRVNEYLRQIGCLLIVKPHPVQDMSVVGEIGLSNFFILDDAALQEKGVQLYELLGRSDALITDYSSVYYDYLLTDKPIGLTVGDIGEYIKKRGFVYRDPLEILKGEYIVNTDDLLTFLSHVAADEDPARAERLAVKQMIHPHPDAASAERVADYLIDHLEAQR